jgi:hypothetical protein
LRNRCADIADRVLFRRGPSRAWLRSAFRDLVAIDDRREAMLASLAVLTRRAMGESGLSLARLLLEGAARIDDGTIRLHDQKLRSYVDISVQVKVVRTVAEYLPGDPMQLVELMLEHDRDSRVALLVKAELLLDRGDVAGAIDAIQHALRVQAVCITAQQMLFRAQRINGEPAGYDLTDKFCHLPFTHMSTGFRGSTFACACPAWVPFSIGNIAEAGSADEIWNSEVAQEIRRSILDGDFSYCSRTQCSFITAHKLPLKSEITKPTLRAYIDNRLTRIDEMPEMVELNHEPTCNLACPSCRTEIVAAKSDEIDVYGAAAEKVILPLLKKVTGHTYITGGGEAFASKHFRSILRTLNREEYPGLRVYLITNGQLITPYRWSEFPNLPEMLAIVSVSVDAARGETYEQLRRPGKWLTLMKNLEFLAGLRRSDRIPQLGLNFVVQQANFREILEFVELADSLAADNIWFQRVVNYGAYDEATFARVNVTAPTHPEHAELLEILRSPILKRPSINTHMLMSLLPEVVASDERIEFLY